MKQRLIALLTVLFLVVIAATVNAFTNTPNCPSGSPLANGNHVTSICSGSNYNPNSQHIPLISSSLCSACNPSGPPGGSNCPQGCSWNGSAWYQWWYNGYCPYGIVPGSGIETASYNSNGKESQAATSSWLTSGNTYMCIDHIQACFHNESAANTQVVQVDYATFTVPPCASTNDGVSCAGWDVQCFTVTDFSKNSTSCDQTVSPSGWCGSTSCIANVSPAAIGSNNNVDLVSYNIVEDCSP